MTDKPPTTEIGIRADNEMLARILHSQYGHLESGEARTALEAVYSPVWNADEFAEHFTVEETYAPYVTVVNKHTGQRGTAMFLDAPRFYFLFKPAVENA